MTVFTSSKGHEDLPRYFALAFASLKALQRGALELELCGWGGFAGLIFCASKEFGKSYSLTLRRWFDSFNAEWDHIANAHFDDRFKNMWNFYLTSCAAGFEYDTTDVAQVTMRRR